MMRMSLNGSVNSVVALQDETISHIAYRVFGSSCGYVEEILKLNPCLCQQSALLEAGTVVVLPVEVPEVVPTKFINLWD